MLTALGVVVLHAVAITASLLLSMALAEPGEGLEAVGRQTIMLGSSLGLLLLVCLIGGGVALARGRQALGWGLYLGWAVSAAIIVIMLVTWN